MLARLAEGGHGWPHLDAVPLVELTFHPDGDGTVMVSELTLSDHLDLDTVRGWFDLGVRDGWGATIDRLEPHLRTTREDSPRGWPQHTAYG